MPASQHKSLYLMPHCGTGGVVRNLRNAEKDQVNIFEEMREALHDAVSYERCKPVDFGVTNKAGAKPKPARTLKNVGCGTRQALVT